MLRISNTNPNTMLLFSVGDYELAPGAWSYPIFAILQQPYYIVQTGFERQPLQCGPLRTMLPECPIRIRAKIQT